MVYKKIVVSLHKKTGYPDGDAVNVETLRRLVVAQRAWIAFRDADSDLAGADSIGGTLENLEIGESHYDLTKARAQKLADLFDGI